MHEAEADAHAEALVDVEEELRHTQLAIESHLIEATPLGGALAEGRGCIICSPANLSAPHQLGSRKLVMPGEGIWKTEPSAAVQLPSQRWASGAK